MKYVTVAPRPARRGLVVAFSAALMLLAWPAVAWAAEPFQASTLQCQQKDQPGNILRAFNSSDAGNVTDYNELDYVTCRFLLTADAAATTGQLEINFGSTNGSCDPFNSYFNLLSDQTTGEAPNIAAGADTQTYGTLTVSESGVITDEGNDLSQLLQVESTGAGAQFVYFQLQFSDDAADCDGSTIHVALGDEVVNLAAASRDVPFPVAQFQGVISAVTFRSLSAQKAGNGVNVRWRTASELQVLGYNVYVERNGKRVKLNAKLIRTKGSAGGSYLFKARVPSGKFWLAALNADGSRTWRSVRAS